jgi:hypothetical protein
VSEIGESFTMFFSTEEIMKIEKFLKWKGKTLNRDVLKDMVIDYCNGGKGLEIVELIKNNPEILSAGLDMSGKILKAALGRFQKV